MGEGRVVMGHDHASLGALAGMGVGLLLHLDPAVVLAAGGVGAGAGLLPDLDEPGSSVAHAAGWISEGVSWVTARLAGGHRRATHCLLAVAGAAAVAAVLTWLHSGSVPWSVGIVGICLALAVRAIPPVGFRPHRIVAALVAAGITWLLVTHNLIGWWVVPVVTVGSASHLLGDAMTTGGIPLLWPDRRRMSWPVLGRTGSPRETVVGIVLLALVALVALEPARELVTSVVRH